MIETLLSILVWIFQRFCCRCFVFVFQGYNFTPSEKKSVYNFKHVLAHPSMYRNQTITVWVRGEATQSSWQTLVACWTLEYRRSGKFRWKFFMQIIFNVKISRSGIQSYTIHATVHLHWTQGVAYNFFSQFCFSTWGVPIIM